MSLILKFHGPRMAGPDGNPLDQVGKQLADAVTVASAGSYTFPASGIYRCIATAAHTIRFGAASLSTSTGGETWGINEKEFRYCAEGEKVYVT